MSNSHRSREMTITHSLVPNTDTAIETTSPTPESKPYTTTPEKEESRSISKTNPRAKTLILCFDGTGDQFDEDNSNIVELFSLLVKNDPENQVVYYQAGIGTYTAPHFASRLTARISKVMDEAIAWNLHSHVMHGYEFLMQNYTPDDKICIFGFSRGAYTARSLAGMVHKIGIIPAWNFQQVPFAWKMYTSDDTDGWKQSKKFKQAFSAHAKIEFVGVWDTVDSVGIIPRRLPFTRSNTNVKTFRHAIALDEHRVKFKARVWERTPREKGAARMRADKSHKQECAFDAEEEKNDKNKKETDVQEVWFAGAHCDVGGGSVPNDTKSSLARITLRWMIRECYKTDCGILFDEEKVKKELDFDLAQWKKSLPSKDSERPTVDVECTKKPTTQPLDVASLPADPDVNDAKSKIYDQLRRNPFWWFFEFIPFMNRSFQNDAEKARMWKYLRCNAGKGRVIPIPEEGKQTKIHKSVLTRIQESEKVYRPKARLINGKSKSERKWPKKGDSHEKEAEWCNKYRVEWVD